MNVRAVIVKSFARIHETNLKKQGVLALTFSNKSDYDKILEGDRFNIINLTNFKQNEKIQLEIIHQDAPSETIDLHHTYNDNQIEWFKAGSALNLIANKKS